MGGIHQLQTEIDKVDKRKKKQNPTINCVTKKKPANKSTLNKDSLHFEPKFDVFSSFF